MNLNVQHKEKYCFIVTIRNTGFWSFCCLKQEVVLLLLCGVIDQEEMHVYLSLLVLLILGQKCSYIETAKHEGERKKERGQIFHFSVIESWLHQPLPKEVCPASILIKHIYNSVPYICNLTIELVPFNWQQMVCDYCLPIRKRKKKACQYLLNMD